MMDIHPEMTIVDLACGTGIVTAQILEFGGHEENIIGIDFSEAMLAIARKKLPTVRFLHCRAERITEVLPAASIDAVICNSAFWQTPIRETLQALYTVLKPAGHFAFNLNAVSYLIGPTTSQSLTKLIHHIAQEEYDIPPTQLVKPRRKLSPLLFTLEEMQKLLRGASFKILKHETARIAYTQEELHELLKIPIITSSYLSNTEYEIGKEIMEKTYQRLLKPFKFISIWHYYLVEKTVC